MPALVQDLVSAQAEHRWESPAIVFRGDALTYGTVDQRAGQLARVLRESGCRRGDRVGVLADHSPETVIALLAACKADCTYVPLDPAGPPTRVGKITQRTDPRCLLISVSGGWMLEVLIERGLIDASMPIGSLDVDLIQGRLFQTTFSMTDVMTLPDRPIGYRNWPDDPAYVVCPAASDITSPDVVITHHDICEFVSWANEYFGVEPGDRHAAYTPLNPDVTIADALGTLAAGATHYPVPQRLATPEHLPAFIRDAELTQWCSTPSTLTQIARHHAVRVEEFRALKRVLWCGGPFSPKALRHWMARLPHAAFTNLYSAKEPFIGAGRCIAARAIAASARRPRN
jgi:non-ribosomal peptide synthetase component F